MAETRKFTNNAVVVADNARIAPDYYILTLTQPEMAAQAEPGQFFQIRLVGDGAPFLPRPFSIYDWQTDKAGKRTGFQVLYKVVGKGTQQMSELGAGDTVAVTGPLGNTFTLPKPGTVALIAAGGVGIASFLAFARKSIAKGFPARDMKLLYGARSSSMLVEEGKFASLGVEVDVITDDGSRGAKGTVLDLLEKHTGDRDHERLFVYGSGPTPMLNAVAAFCNRIGVRAELSLEARMICGFGACNSCVVAVKADKAADGWEYKLVCRDGPIFAASSLIIR